MPGRSCAVASCKNNKMTLKKAGVTDIIFHCFPVARDLVSSTMQKEWIRRCKKVDTFNLKNAWVCSTHFTEDSYERDLENELLGLPLRRKLKKTAVPALNLGTIDEKKGTNKFLIKPEMSLQELQDSKLNVYKPSTSICPKVENTSDVFEASKQHQTDFSPMSPTVDNEQKFSVESIPLIEENYKNKYEQLLKKYCSLKLQSSNKIKNLNKMIKYYKFKYYNNPIRRTAKTQTAEEILNSVLTKNQIDLLSKRKRKVIWTREEISVALTIRNYSKNCYLYLRDKLNYPLPALSSLRRWASRLDASQGVLKDVLMVMELVGEDMTDFEDSSNSV